jgi:hypothetical protein
MTLAQYKTKVPPSFDARAKIAALEDQLTSAQAARDSADAVTNDTNQKVVNGVKGDPNYGDDSDLYDAMGYVRKSERGAAFHGKRPPRKPQRRKRRKSVSFISRRDGQPVPAVCFYSFPELPRISCVSRDSRMKERKKYGQPGARKRFQFSKR